MADAKTTGLSADASPSTSDYVMTVDVSDTSMAPTGTNKKVLIPNLLDLAFPIDLTADVTGDLPLANLAQGSALSVLGVTGNATADHASIAAGSDKQVLRRNGTSVGFGAVDLSSSNAVTGVLPVANFTTGTPTGSKFVRDDGVLAVPSSSGTVVVSTFNARLTTESGVPVSSTDRTAQSTIYLTPYLGNQIALYDGAAWAYFSLTEISLALSGLTSGKNYDVFVYDNAGTRTLELSAAWTTDTARADALALQDGVYVKSGATTRRHAGTIRTTGTTTTEDSGGITGTTQVGGKRFVWNRYNQAPRQLNVIDTTDTWSYTTDTIRQANGTAGNKAEWVTGDVATLVTAEVRVNWQGTSNSARGAKVGIGVDSTAAFSGLVGLGIITSVATAIVHMTGAYRGQPGLGYHFAAWCEKGADGTSVFYGDDGGDSSQSGMSVMLWN